MKKLWSYLLLTMLFSISTAAQDNRVDSLLKLFDNNNSLKVANQLFEIFGKEEITEGQIRLNQDTHPDTLRQQVWYWAAEYYNYHQQYKKASDYGLKALPLCKSDGGSSVEGDCLAVVAIALLRQGDFQKAIGYARRCNELDRQNGDPSNIASSLNLMAAIFTSSYQHEEAEQCILEGLKYAKEAGDTSKQAILNGMACEIYYYLKDYNHSLDYGRQALALEQQLGRQVKIAIRQSQIAGALIGLRRLDEARGLLEEALPVLRESNPHSYAIASNQMGDILLNDHRDAEAAACFTEALRVLTSQNDLYNECHSRRGLYQSLRKTNPTLAMEHNDRYNQLRDSMYSMRTSALLSQYAALSGNMRLQAEKAELERKHRQTIAISISASLVAVLLLWLLARHFIRRQQRRIAELTQEIANLKPSPQESDDGSSEFLLNVVEVVNKLLPQGRLGVDQVAEDMNMSTATLRRRLLQATGESPKAYFTAIQMQKARQLLSQNELPVAEIARLCGYQEVTNFTRAFKRIYNISPSQYIKDRK